MTKTQQTIVFIIVALLICLAGCKNSNQPTIKQPVKVAYFNAGDTIYPDYACSDTLIVINADGLNKGMAFIEQGIIDGTDGDIDSIFSSNCIIINHL